VHRVAKTKPKTQTATATPAAPPQQTQSSPPQDMLSYGPIPGESAAGMIDTSAPPAKKVASAPKPPPPAPKKVTVAQKPPAPPKQTPPKKTAAAAPQQTTSDFNSGFFSNVQTAPAAAQPSPAKQTKTASAEPADARGLNKRSTIPFSPGAEEPAPEVLDTVKNVSAQLNDALSNGSARVELEAFGGKPNDKSSDARRISLKRALIVRQLLIDEGVPSERIDVRAMGGASEGAPDRVDIFVRT
jgi:outer membrane protein OmpA-like peptidoglycan-associated protein